MTPGGATTDDPAAFAAAVQKLVRSTVPTLDVMGIEVVEAGPGHVRTRLPFRPENGNHIGTVYAGVLFSFLETSGGALVLVSFDVSKWIPVVVEGTIRFLRPVTGAVVADLAISDADRDAVHAALDSDPKHRWTFRATAVSEDGRVACEADFVYRFRSVGGG
jgi:thioesterase domain-containing protein